MNNLSRRTQAMLTSPPRLFPLSTRCRHYAYPGFPAGEARFQSGSASFPSQTSTFPTSILSVRKGRSIAEPNSSSRRRSHWHHTGSSSHCYHENDLFRNRSDLLLYSHICVFSHSRTLNHLRLVGRSPCQSLALSVARLVSCSPCQLLALSVTRLISHPDLVKISLLLCLSCQYSPSTSPLSPPSSGISVTRPRRSLSSRGSPNTSPSPPASQPQRRR
jgi:hypothetical protein